MMFGGIMFTCTVIGAIVGIPLIIGGVIMIACGARMQTASNVDEGAAGTV